MSRLHRRGPAELHANLTPMIDVTFLLIVFFVLVSQIVEVENVDMSLPELADPRTELPGDEQRAVINVVPAADGSAREYKLGATVLPATEGGRRQLTDELASLLRRNPSMRINLRADQRTHYEWVQPVLQAVSTAAGNAGDVGARPRINLVVVRDE
ncbi:MAG: biopolymer transporter ExbD [Phycisphaerales bacterium]|nr:biopolymer transporter ExbD [Phycisphaerae bacterium]NNF43735.1 biopolymer transporter ExbD [Phycisphaerales bacterium]NNM27555.1 biopolymer transporter ExbD [Phycisphaerales bacterium]